ncbi:MAG: hypothetical protein WKG01_10610 [Kofleriaceae bacterium]
MAEQQPPGASGVFKSIADGARKLKRAISEPSVTTEHGHDIGEALVAGRIEDIHALGTPAFQERNPRDAFCARWRETVLERGPFTGFDVSDAGTIDLVYIPGLEEVPQAQFVAFLQVLFASASVPLDDDKAFAIGVLLVDEDGTTKLGAIHAR